jgi:hypothetical protein
MFPYLICDQTVTVYRKTGGTVERRVRRGCYYHYEDCLREGDRGLQFQRKFLLIQPGDEPLRPGDRVMEGEGPEVRAEQWESFLPATVPGLSQAAYAAPWCWEGKIRHWEAGRK